MGGREGWGLRKAVFAVSKSGALLGASKYRQKNKNAPMATHGFTTGSPGRRGKVTIALVAPS